MFQTSATKNIPSNIAKQIIVIQMNYPGTKWTEVEVLSTGLNVYLLASNEEWELGLSSSVPE